MELLKLKELKNVYSVVKLKNTLLVSNYENVINCYNYNNLEIICEMSLDLKLIETFKYNAKDYSLSTDSNLFIFTNNKFVPFLSDYYCTRSTEIDKYFMIYKGDIGNKLYHIYSLLQNKILWTTENIPLVTIGNHCFSQRKTNFKAHNIETGAVLWDKNITDDFEEAKTYKFLIVYKNILIVAINETILAGYNVKTGVLLWQVKDTNNSNLLVDKDGKLKGISITSYFETDIKTGIYRRVEFAPYDAFNEPGFFSSERDNFTIIDHYIITTDFYSNRIAAFNMQTMQYDWMYTEDNATGFPASRPIKYFAPYLCLIDNKDTLHIYQVKKDNQVESPKAESKKQESSHKLLLLFFLLPKFIAYTVFIFAVAALMAIQLGPSMISSGKQMSVQPLTYHNINTIHIYTHIANKNYVSLDFINQQDTVALRYNLKDGKHKPLTQLFYKNGLFKNPNNFPDALPMAYTNNDLGFIDSIDVLYTQYDSPTPQLNYFAINGEKIKGNIPYFRKYSTIVFGYLITIVSGIGCFLVLWGGYYQLKKYNRTGAKPYIPNRWNGLKEFFNLFKKE